jgi:hypothetical protein
MISVFENIMGSVSRIAQSRGGKHIPQKGYFKESNTGQEDAHLRFLGLTAVESIIASLVTWCSEIDEEHEHEVNDSINPVVVTARNPLGTISMVHVSFI